MIINSIHVTVTWQSFTRVSRQESCLPSLRLRVTVGRTRMEQRNIQLVEGPEIGYTPKQSGLDAKIHFKSATIM